MLLLELFQWDGYYYSWCWNNILVCLSGIFERINHTMLEFTIKETYYNYFSITFCYFVKNFSPYLITCILLLLKFCTFTKNMSTFISISISVLELFWMRSEECSNSLEITRSLRTVCIFQDLPIGLFLSALNYFL